MPTILAQDRVDSAKKTLLDETSVRWSEPELLDYLNDAQRLIVMSKPDAYSKNAVVQLVEGTKQTVPADCIQLIRLVRNMGVDGATPGKVIRLTSMEALDDVRPDWHFEAGDAISLNWVRNGVDAKSYYVTPPQPAVSPGQVEIIYSATPPDVALNEVIALDDIYSNIIYLLILWRALSKEAETQDPGKAQSYLNIALQSLGVKALAQQKAEG